jgi:hypothetical protein
VTAVNLAQVQRKLCAWDDPPWERTAATLRRLAEEQARRGAALVSPYLCEVYGLEPDLILDMVELISRAAAARVRASALPALALPPLRLAPRPPAAAGAARRVRVGYFSMTGLDSGTLSVGRFLQSVLAAHARSARLEARCFAMDPARDAGPVHRRIAAGCGGAVAAVGGALPLTAAASEVRAAELQVRPRTARPTRPGSHPAPGLA